jgi:hypothetical protein
VEPATNEPLPLELPETAPAITCWYCGSDRGPFEREHQLPVSRGGGEVGATTLVWADARCNALKGPLDAEEFREGLAERLGLDPAQIVFAGEATLERPATSLQAVRSLQADRSVVRIDPIAAMVSYNLIGQAQGMLMERFKVTAEQAFALPSRASQDTNVKLPDVVQRLIDTGESPGR